MMRGRARVIRSKEMITQKEYERLERVGTEPHRSYYIPFAETDEITRRYGIVDRTKSSRFLSLDGVWQIKQHVNIEKSRFKRRAGGNDTRSRLRANARL